MTLSQAFPRRRFTGDEVVRMVHGGILSENEQIELLDGELVQMTPQGPPHAGVSTRLTRLLSAAYAGIAHVRAALPLDCGRHDLPEPDFAIVTPDEDELMKRHPRGDEAKLAVEVAYSSHAVDRYKASVYARAGVQVYWLIDLPGRRIEVHEQPQPDGSYGLVTILKPGDSIAPPGTSALWTVDGLLPAP